MTFSPAVTEALGLHSGADARGVHWLEVGLARLLSEHAPPDARRQLELAEAFLRQQASPAELKDARQDCWTSVGSLACGCSVADSAAGAALLACLEADATAHSPSALREQVERALRAGATEQAVLAVLASGR